MNEMRKVLEISGSDRIRFLSDLVTQDLAGLSEGLVYSALLSPQGKYLFDFFLFERNRTVFIDVAAASAQALVARLGMYRLRADVKIRQSTLTICRGIAAPPDGAMNDPRHGDLGWRCYRDEPVISEPVNWDDLRVRLVVPQTGIELISNESYILEMGFERLNGVSFHKGCYVGQEVTARMKHKTTLRKGLARVALSGSARTGDAILRGDAVVGTLHTISGRSALAYLRFDKAGEGMKAGDATVHWDGVLT